MSPLTTQIRSASRAEQLFHFARFQAFLRLGRLCYLNLVGTGDFYGWVMRGGELLLEMRITPLAFEGVARYADQG